MGEVSRFNPWRLKQLMGSTAGRIVALLSLEHITNVIFDQLVSMDEHK